MVQRIRDKRITKLSTGILEESKYVKRQKEKPNKNYAKKKKREKSKMHSYARLKELALWREERRGGGRASPRSTRSLPRRRQM